MVIPLKFVGDDPALVQALRANHPGAVAAFYYRYAPQVRRALRSTLGPDADLPDLLQEAFIRAIDGIGSLEDVEKLGSWITTIAVYTARAHLRLRTRRKWLSFFSPDDGGAREDAPQASEARCALREVYEILDTLPLNERMAFVLRVVDRMTLPCAAEACGVSLATLKRRLARAESRFLEAAQLRPELQAWLEALASPVF